HKQKQRRTRSGRKVADYYEPTTDSAEEEDNNYSLDADYVQNKNRKESIAAISESASQKVCALFVSLPLVIIIFIYIFFYRIFLKDLKKILMTYLILIIPLVF